MSIPKQRTATRNVTFTHESVLLEPRSTPSVMLTEIVSGRE